MPPGSNPLSYSTKFDLVDEIELRTIVTKTSERIKDVPIITISNETLTGYDELTAIIESGKTYCLLGSSGVGKSTLLNNISGNAIMKTDSISSSVNKGKHTTSHRELILLEGGGVLIDNPGMREVGIADTTSGLELTFDKILQLAQNCKFKDCAHLNEDGCAVIEAVEKGEVDEDSFENYHKMQREKMHFETAVHEKREKDKVLGKLMKSVIKAKKQNRY